MKHIFQETFTGLRSADPATRRWSRRFYGSCVAVLLTFILGISALLKIRSDKKEKARALQEYKELQAQKAKILADSKKPPTFLSLGTFTLELKPESDPGFKRKSKHAPGSVAELEVVITCDQEELCGWFERNMALARGELSPLFVPMERELILSPDGKKAFREEIRTLLTRLKESRGLEGQLLDVFFPRFILV